MNAVPDYLAAANGHNEGRRFVGDFGPRELVSFTKAASPQSRLGLGRGF